MEEIKISGIWTIGEVEYKGELYIIKGKKIIRLVLQTKEINAFFKDEEFPSKIDLITGITFLNKIDISLLNCRTLRKNTNLNTGITTYLIDCRFNKSKLIKRVQQIYDNRDKIQIFDFDARDFLRLNFPNNSFFFIDPPYFKKGSQLYQNYFTIQDHREIAEIVRELNYPWIVTYDNVDEIIRMYDFSNYQTYQLTYTVERKYIGTEIMFYRENLNIDL